MTFISVDLPDPLRPHQRQPVALLHNQRQVGNTGSPPKVSEYVGQLQKGARAMPAS